MISLAHVLQLLLQYKYALLFPIAVVEGPIVSILGGFLASSNYFNIYLVYLFVVLGDLVGDTIYYSLGRFGGTQFVKKYGKYLGITDNDIAGLESHFHDHAGKTLVIGKFAHGLGAVVLFAAGLGQVPYRKFFFYNLFSTMAKSLILVVVGYYFGYAYQRINDYLGYASYIFVGLALILVIAYYMATKAVRRLL